MKLLSSFWNYWKWFCTALVTSTVVLLLLAAIVGFFKPSGPSQQTPAEQCLERGGAWVEEEGRCRFSA